MNRYQGRHRLLAVGLAMLAGFVDALGFLTLGGMFVSFMSGNSTSMAVSFALHGQGGLTAAALIVAFVGGVMAGALVGRAAGRWRKQIVLGMVTLLLLLTSTLALIGIAPLALTLLMAFAMGIANDVFQRAGEVSIGVTYMTGTLVKFGQALATALTGGAPFGWLPHLLLWLGLVAGAIAGASLYPLLGLHALWIATAFAGMLLAGAIAIGPLADAPIPQA
jgi:uncharacterized membrane protein YoaK (UPF0700 family)